MPEKATITVPTSTATIQPTETPKATITPPAVTATSTPLFGLCRDTTTPVVKNNTIKRLVYIDDSKETHDVWLWDMGKEPVQLTQFGDTTNVSISKDGQNITFTRQLLSGKNEFWEIRANATGLRKLSANPETANPKVAGNKKFEYSPDGKWLLTYGDDGIRLYDAKERPYNFPDLPKYKAITEDDRHLLIPPTWNPDSKSFLLVLPESASVYQPGSTFKVLRIWPEDQQIDQIGLFIGFAPDVKFSPDQKFMFYHADANMRPNELHLVDLDEKKDIIFSKQDDLLVDAWSPNSRDFIFDIEYSTYLGNVCKNIESATKLPYLNSFQFPIWLDDTTLLIVELGDDRLRDRYLSFEDLTNYKSEGSVLALRSYDFAIVSP